VLGPNELPHDTGYPSAGATIVYEGGDYPALLESALAAAGYQPEDELAPGVGIGVACHIESTGVGFAETVRVSLAADGSVGLVIGTTPSGQGHETMAGQVLADRLGWPFERIQVVARDTGLAPAWSLTTSGSRSAIEVGNAVAIAGRDLRDRLLDYVIAHDSGRIINPLTADGQLVGGWVHGLGMALYEEAAYSETGDFLAASFLDYVIPSAGEVPVMSRLVHRVTPSSRNPEGLLGIGESGTIPAPAAIAGAVEDTLRRAGRQVRIDRIPITAETPAVAAR
jgi:CO/xanthine dehydrogenase Mo-binding subunit